MGLYLRLDPWKEILIYEIGCSCPSVFFCNKTQAIVWSDAKENIWKSRPLSGLAKVGEWERAYLMLSKACFPSSLQTMSCPFLNISVMGFTISAKLGVNSCTKFTRPRKDWIPFIVLGKGTSCMTLTFSGSIHTPYFETIWPNSLASNIPMKDFLGLTEIPNFRHLSKVAHKWEIWSYLFLDYIVISSW